MEILWSPWRTQYVESFKDESNDCNSCFICEALEKIDEEDSRLVVFKDHLSLIIMNKFPYNPGHLLVAPKRHLADLTNLNEDELLSLSKSLQISINALNELMKPHGFNIGINLGRVAGAGLPEHLHFHVIPRWNGDTSFISIVSDTKVISQSLTEMHTKLKKIFTGLVKNDSLKF
ncbi:MAG: HIT family protein [Candidatus Kapaibacteriales bacterium]